MAGGEGADHLLRAGDGAGFQLRPRRLGAVAVIDDMVGAVGIGRPQALRIAEIAIDILPAVVDHAAVGQQRGVSLVQRAVADLLDVGPVGLHREEVAHDVPVAHAVLGLAGRREEDLAVGQVDRVDVGDARAEGQLLQVRAVGMDLVEVVIVAGVHSHREEDVLAVEADVGIPHDALGHLVERGRGGGGCGGRFGIRSGLRRESGQIDRFQRAPAAEAAGVDLAGLKHRLGVVMIGCVLGPHDEQQRLAGQQGVGEQGLATQGFELLLKLRCLGTVRRPDLAFDAIQPGQILPAVGVAIREGGNQVVDGQPGGLPAGEFRPLGLRRSDRRCKTECDKCHERGRRHDIQSTGAFPHCGNLSLVSFLLTPPGYAASGNNPPMLAKLLASFQSASYAVCGWDWTNSICRLLQTRANVRTVSAAPQENRWFSPFWRG